VLIRRLIVLYLVGTLLLPVGLSAFLSRTALGGILSRVIGLVLALVGAVLLFAGLVGAVFRIVADANILAAKTG